MKQPLTCIVIDDDLLFVKKMESLIDQMDWLVLQSSFTEPVKAATAIIKQQPDIIFLDLQMPHMDGYAWLDWLFPILRIKKLAPLIVAMSEQEPRPHAMLDQFLCFFFKHELDNPQALQDHLKRRLQGPVTA